MRRSLPAGVAAAGRAGGRLAWAPLAWSRWMSLLATPACSSASICRAVRRVPPSSHRRHASGRSRHTPSARVGSPPVAPARHSRRGRHTRWRPQGRGEDASASARPGTAAAAAARCAPTASRSGRTGSGEDGPSGDLDQPTSQDHDDTPVSSHSSDTRSKTRSYAAGKIRPCPAGDTGARWLPLWCFAGWTLYGPYRRRFNPFRVMRLARRGFG